jgi:hypothetical protein
LQAGVSECAVARRVEERPAAELRDPDRGVLLSARAFGWIESQSQIQRKPDGLRPTGFLCMEHETGFELLGRRRPPPHVGKEMLGLITLSFSG